MSMTEYKLPLTKDLIKSTENNNHKFLFISLFAGGGGSSLGYRMSGGKALAINEFIPDAANTYKANWKGTHIFDADIKKLTGDEILKKLNLKKGELDLLDGSPPCSAFSVAGRKNKGWGKSKKYSDTSQESVEDLFFDYIRILRDIKPKVFVAENVKGLAMGKSKGYLNEILRELRLSGYHVECKVLDAKWLGVPQSRNRLIFVGVRDDLYKSEMKGKLHPQPQSKQVTLKEAFHGLVFTDKDKKDTDLSRYKMHRMMLTMKEGEHHTRYFSLIKASKHKPSPCITAAVTISAAAPRHWDNRAFTIDELKRIMSVPDDYILTGSYAKQAERLGRMVAPLMMKAVSGAILKTGVFNENT